MARSPGAPRTTTECNKEPNDERQAECNIDKRPARQTSYDRDVATHGVVGFYPAIIECTDRP